MMGFFRSVPARLDRLLSVRPMIGRMPWHELRGRRPLSLAERLAMLPCRGVPVAAPVSIRWNEIRWDEPQIPIIVAGNEDDLAVGLGMVHAHRRQGRLELSQPRARHLFIVESAAPALGRGNDDDRAHRAGLDPPEVLAVGHGAFAAWVKQRGRLGGQNKVPRVIADPALFNSLRNFMTGRSI